VAIRKQLEHWGIAEHDCPDTKKSWLDERMATERTMEAKTCYAIRNDFENASSARKD
jgi:hypothetical protein